MSKYTKIYSKFLLRLAEVRLLRQRARALERRKNAFKHDAEINAFCRSAVVLLSSHIEGYIEELGEHTLDKIYNKRVCRSKFSPLIFYYTSQKNIKNIRNTQDYEKITETIFDFINTEGDMWKKTTPLSQPIDSDLFNKGFSNPKFEKAKSYFSRFGYSEFHQDFMRELRADGQPTITALNHIVDTRNAIAHGDPRAKKTPTEVESMIDYAILFCRTTDTIFGKWCKSNLCSIR